MAVKSARSKNSPAAVEPVNEASGWDPKLMETLSALLYRADLKGEDLDSELRRLEQNYQDSVYSELIYLQSHLRFDSGEAKRHWQRIVAHRAFMQKRLGTRVDLRVALVSYFVEVNRKLTNPKIIEMKLFEQTQASAYRDELTGLFNFRLFREYLGREIDGAERYNTPVSLVMIDIDDFKEYNDHNGHEAGNQALATVASVLRESLRKIDVPARYGGEEFAVILPSTSKPGAYQVAERSRLKIETCSLKLTASMGIATYPADAREASQLVRLADRAMYVAKARGKNQVHLYGRDRRSHRRISASLDGRLCVLTPDYHPVTTVNISEGGLLFHVDRNLPIGSLINVDIMIPGSKDGIAASGHVVRVEEKESGKFEAAIRIVNVPAEDRIRLSKYLREAGPPPDAGGPEGTDS